MCGRTACSLCQERYQKASSIYDTVNDIHKKPAWDDSSNLQFHPSVNKAPSEVTPVLMWDINKNDYFLKPMIWGMIPPWHKGDYRSVKLSTNNARLETLKQSSLYKVPLKNGRRCVIICEGFYEWQTVGKTKQPYFIYNNQPPGRRPEEQEHWVSAEWTEKMGWNGPSLLSMAGLYSEWVSPENDVIHSYSIITMESNQTLAWLHHRMPAILSPDQVKDWLNVEDLGEEEALGALVPEQTLSWHPVSTSINNSRNKQLDLNKPVQLNKTYKGSRNLMESWLKLSTKREIKSEPDEANSKKIKTEK